MFKINKKLLINDAKKIPTLLVGLILLSCGVSILRLSGSGLDPWGVFHEGLSNYTGVSFGTISIIVGLTILVGSLFLRIFPGIGTILNIVLVGPFIDVMYRFLMPFEVNKTLFLFLGFFLINFGRALYISSNTGAGPRDAIYVGLTKILNLKVTYTKPAVEIFVTFIGYLFGGTIGFGLVLMSIFSGFMINTSFKILRYNPMISNHSNLKSYINYL